MARGHVPHTTSTSSLLEMHHALEIQEILLDIFSHYDPRKEPSNLVALARTCRTFKEPALDVLWEELDDLSPLARCLPRACRQLIPSEDKRLKVEQFQCYSFRRALSQTEWGILRSYTHRVRSMTIQDLCGLSRKSIKTLSKPPAAEQLFPKLRFLRLDYDPATILLFSLPLPSLVSLDLVFDNPRLFRNSLKPLAKISPDLRNLSIEMYNDDDLEDDDLDCRFVYPWRNLHTVACSDILLGAHALAHLSRMPALVQLSFKLGGIMSDRILLDRPFVFRDLQRLKLCSQSLASVSNLLSQTQMLSVTYFRAIIDSASTPSGQDLSSLFTNLGTSGIGRTVKTLRLASISGGGPDSQNVLTFKHLQPCATFTKLRRLKLNIINWKVDLTDGDLLILISAWPHLEQLLINEHWGWETRGGITPNGLLQLLQKCRSLKRIAIAMDTRGFTELPRALTSPGLTLPSDFLLDVIDSLIDSETVPVVASFFATIASRANFSFCAWRGFRMRQSVYFTFYKSRWNGVKRRFKDAVGRRS